MTGIVIVTVILAGCNAKILAPEKTVSGTGGKVSGTENVASDSLDGAARMEQCQRELESLQKINVAVYQKRKVDFDRLMSGAGIYTGVRSSVSTYTQGAVDAFYRFKADKLCADISNDVLNELAKQ